MPKGIPPDDECSPVSQYQPVISQQQCEPPTRRDEKEGNRIPRSLSNVALTMSQVGDLHMVSQVYGSQVCSSQVCSSQGESLLRGIGISQCAEVGIQSCGTAIGSQQLIYGSILNRPLRVVHVGSILFQAGIEVWLKSLIRYACPRRIQFTRCLVTTNYYDPDVVAGLGVPVEIGTGELGVKKAAKNCDVMLISGPPEVGQWLTEVRPPLCIGIAHGEGHGTRQILEGCAGILDHTIAVSSGVQATVCQGFSTTTIHNGVDLAHLTRSRPRTQVRTALGFREGDFVVGSVCRLSPEKKPERLIEAIAQLPEKYKLLLVGWGPMYDSLKYLANRVAPGRVSILHAKSDLGDYYQAMDAFSLVSDTEGYGLAIMEAMFSQLPIIVSPVGFVPEWIEDRVNGVIVDGSAKQVARAIEMIDSHPRWAAGIAREARSTAERHGFARDMAAKYEDLIHQLWLTKFSS